MLLGIIRLLWWPPHGLPDGESLALAGQGLRGKGLLQSDQSKSEGSRGLFRVAN